MDGRPFHRQSRLSPSFSGEPVLAEEVDGVQKSTRRGLPSRASDTARPNFIQTSRHRFEEGVTANGGDQGRSVKAIIIREASHGVDMNVLFLALLLD